MDKTFFWIIITTLLLFFSNCRPVKPLEQLQTDQIKLMFYNVENLFDTQNDPNTNDDEYLPESELKWDETRYEKKLGNLAKVIKAACNNDTPAFLGLCEIENKQVVEDLVKHFASPGQSFGIVHKDSPDERGIDVALVYDKDIFQLEKQEFLTITLPPPYSNDRTRDILMAEGKIGNDKLYVFVNHWPSRREGETVSEPKRLAAANTLKQRIDRIEANDKNANIVIIGDFNDEPTNKSITEVLGAKAPDQSTPPQAATLYNLTYPIKQQGKGSYNYQGEWNMLDQIIVSGHLLEGKGIFTTPNSVIIFQEDWMMYKHAKDGPKPSRTYAGPKYIGDYSDHLPSVLTLNIK
ncbi:MAG: hypothetical protein R2798_07690 [Chitinophagales bacterium]|nr:hypothetical protein [Bacteroidota bacterium]MCB9042318.1 hypothetical protein [Chitinophagales bacterium]